MSEDEKAEYAEYEQVKQERREMGAIQRAMEGTSKFITVDKLVEKYSEEERVLVDNLSDPTMYHEVFVSFKDRDEKRLVKVREYLAILTA